MSMLAVTVGCSTMPRAEARRISDLAVPDGKRICAAVPEASSVSVARQARAARPGDSPAVRPSGSAITSRHEGDISLAAALVAGDPGAARQAWIRLAPFVRRILRRHVGPGPDHQDLCQEVFLRFFSRIAELRNQAALYGFLFGICLGVAQNARRRAFVRRRIARAPTEELPDHSVGPSDLDAREALAGFCRILAQVDAADRALFVIRHVDKRELAHIAAASGWPLTTTKRRLGRATRRVGLRMKRVPALAEYVERLLASRR
jgi:RNA polymerase sigma-70 factor, ECF subfamily